MIDIDLIGYDPQRALDYASAFSRPRLVGTDAEKSVGQEIAACLESFGFQVEPQAFSFSTAPDSFLTLEILFSQILILLTLWLHWLDSPARTISALFLIILISLAGPLYRSVQDNCTLPETSKPAAAWSVLCSRLGKRYATLNYYARLPGMPAGPGAMQLILVAHYDSKSQRLPLILRIALFVVGIGGSLVFAVSILFSSFYAPLAAIGILAGGLSLLADLPLLFLDRGNASSGAIDDASGLGVVLHLAEVLAAQPDIAHQVGLSVLITSAEEFGTLGATAFVRQNSEQLHLQDRDSRLYVLNFDGPGVDGKLYWVGGDRPGKQASEPCLSFLVPQACAELDYHLGKFSLPGALFDHLPFTHHGFDAGSLISIGRASLSIHTSRDSVDQLHIRGFEQAGRVALQIIGKLQTPSKVE